MAKRTPPRARDDARASPAQDEMVETSGPDNAAPASIRATDGKAWRRINFTSEAIGDIRERYEETPESVASIARDYEVHPVTIERLARRHKWSKCRRRPLDVPAAIRLRRRAEQLAAATAAVQGASQAQAPDRHPGVRAQRASKDDGGSGSSSFEGGLRPPPQDDGGADDRPAVQDDGSVPQMIAASVDAMLREAQAQLAEVTARREVRRGRQTYTESNTATRTLSHLIATVKELESMQPAPATAAFDSGVDDDEMPRDIDEFRRALAERIEAFVRSRTEPDDAHGGGEDSASRVDEV